MSKSIATLQNVYGAKSITLDQYPDDAWEFLSGDPDHKAENVKAMWEVVPWLYQGVNIISQSAAEIPISLYQGEKEITSNEDWEVPAALGYIPDIGKLVRKLSAALVLEGQGYLFRDTIKGGRAIKKLFFWNPTSVKVDWDLTRASTTKQLYFKRTVNGTTTTWTDQEVIYFWPDDGYTEVGPPASSPAKAALAAAGVLHNADQFISAYWKHGAIRAMMLSVKGNPATDERKKLNEWWKAITTGIKNAFSVFTINADSVVPTMIGDGIEGLQNTALTVEKREDISTALGVPQSILFSTNAGGLGGAGVVTSDQVKLYELTVIPLVKLICAALNEQQLNQYGYRLVVNENEMAMYQEDEAARAASLNSMVSALAEPEKFLIAADIIGFELDDTARALVEALIAKKEANAEQLRIQMQPKTDTAAPDNNQPAAPADNSGNTADNTADNPPINNVTKTVTWQDDLNRWRRKALKAGGDCEFTSSVIPESVKDSVHVALKIATNPDEIKAAFVISEEDPQPEPARGYDDIALKSLADAIMAATNAIKQPDTIMPAPVYNMTMPNITVNMPEQTAPSVTVNVPEQPAPVVNVTNEVQPTAPAVNNITVQPANIVFPPAPKEATITTDMNGNKTLRVKG